MSVGMGVDEVDVVRALAYPTSLRSSPSRG